MHINPESLAHFSRPAFAELLTYLNLSVIELDAQGQIRYLSEPACQALFLDDRTVIGSRLVELLSESKGELSSLQELAQELFKKGGASDKAFQAPVVSADGAGHNWSFRPFGDGCWLIVGGLDDRSDYLKEQFEQTMKLVQDHKKALDSSSIVAITDQRGVITYVNDTFCRISGYSRAELIGNTHQIVNSQTHDKTFFADLWRTIASGQVWKGEIRNRAKNGTYYWVNTTIIPFLDRRNGRPYQYVAIRSDITKQKQMQETLNQERMRSWHAEKMVSLGEMAAGVAHELGNPIASIQAWLDVMESQLLRGVSDLDKFLKTLPKVREDARRIRDIIRGMLTYARDGSRDPFHSENISQIIKLVHDYCSYKLRKYQVEWRFECSNPYLEIDCRLSEISQVFVNFILNACDAISDKEERWIDISVRELEDGLVVIHFMDSGNGISKEHVERIWDPFFTTKPVGSGTGLGLSITRSIIENHNGRVYVDRESPNTKFVVELPKRQVDPS
ncbi:MAG: PAS domain S-box protein [Oligoflexus sp.]